MRISRLECLLVTGLAVGAGAHADEPARLTIESPRALAYRALPIGADDRARTGVSAWLESAAEGFVVVDIRVKADDDATRNELYSRVNSIRSADVSLRVGEWDFDPVASFDQGEGQATLINSGFTGGVPLSSVMHSAIGGVGRLVFDGVPLDADGPWTLVVAGAETPVEPPSDVQDRPVSPASLVDAEIRSVRRHAEYSFGVGERNLNRVRYSMPSGVLLEVSLDLRSRLTEPEPGLTCAESAKCCPNGLTLHVGGIMLRDRATGHLVPVLTASLSQNPSRMYSSNFTRVTSLHVHDDKPQLVSLFYAVPASQRGFELVLDGVTLAAHEADGP